MYPHVSMLERFQVEYFDGSHYWEVKLDGTVVTTCQSKREADLFVAEAVLRATQPRAS